jgi:hypothetical protein
MLRRAHAGQNDPKKISRSLLLVTFTPIRWLSAGEKGKHVSESCRLLKAIGPLRNRRAHIPCHSFISR